MSKKFLPYIIKIFGIFDGFKSLLAITEVDVLNEMFDGNGIVAFVNFELANAADGFLILTFLVNAEAREGLASMPVLGASRVTNSIEAHITRVYSIIRWQYHSFTTLQIIQNLTHPIELTDPIKLSNAS